MERPYFVTLNGVDSIPATERIAAELRFIKELEKGLGSADEVAKIYRAWLDACESDASELDQHTTTLAVRWPKAFETAQRAGLRAIGDEDAHFELKLDRASAAG